MERPISLYGNGIYCPFVDMGIVLLGGPGSGKSTIAYQLVTNHHFLNVGDDVITFSPDTKMMSWGSMNTGGDRIAYRPLNSLRDGADDVFVIGAVRDDSIIQSVKVDLALNLLKQDTCRFRPSNNYCAYEARMAIEQAGIPVKNLHIQEGDIAGALDDIMHIIAEAWQGYADEQDLTDTLGTI